MLVAPAARAETSALPVGPRVGDQELSPFYRWTGTLPDRPGVMLREEPMPAQAEIAQAASAERIPDALAFFRDVLAGRKPASNCGAIAEPAAPGAPAQGIAFNE